MAIVLRAGAALLLLAQEDLESVERGFARLSAAAPHQLPLDPYGRTVFSSPPAVRALAEAIAALRSSYRAGRTAELVRERQIRASSLTAGGGSSRKPEGLVARRGGPL